MKPTLNRVTQTITTTPNGQIVQTYQVNFSVGEHGPFTIQIPQAEFSAANAQAAMQKIADQVNAIAAGSAGA